MNEIKTIHEKLEKLTGKRVLFKEGKLDPNGKYSYKLLKVYARQHGLDIENIDPQELIAGYNDELEHSDVTGGDPVATLKIVLKHLEHDRNYYVHLKAAGIDEEGLDFQMGRTAFGKPEDNKYNQDTVMAEQNDDKTNDQSGNQITDKSSGELALVEKLAAVEHEQWKGWATDLMEKEPNISAKRLERWRTYMGPYESLPNEVKELDREYARKTLAIFKEYLKLRLKEKNAGK
jgi:hypothetical protein